MQSRSGWSILEARRGLAGTAAAALVLLLLAGCAGYRLGPTGGVSAGARSIQVMEFYNDTLEPRLSDSVMTQMRRCIQRDGTFKLATGSTADVIVSGVLTRYDRQPLSYSKKDSETTQDYRLTLVAQVTARDRLTGKTLLDRQVRGHSIVRVGTDLPDAERQVMPLLTEDLAKNITELLADGSW